MCWCQQHQERYGRCLLLNAKWNPQLIPEPQRVGSRIHVCGASVVNGLAQLDRLSGLRGVLRSSRSNTSDQRYTTRLPRLMYFGPVPR
jgi:hypothetical protein